MSDILSQNEIDALLKQLSDGDLDMDQIQGEDEKQEPSGISAQKCAGNGGKFRNGYIQ